MDYPGGGGFAGLTNNVAYACAMLQSIANLSGSLVKALMMSYTIHAQYECFQCLAEDLQFQVKFTSKHRGPNTKPT